MSRLSINRLVITLDGVPAEIAEEAVEGLAEELSRRLGASALLDLGAAALELGALEIRAVNSGTLDAAALRGIIAEQLLAALASAQEAPLTQVEEPA